MKNGNMYIRILLSCILIFLVPIIILISVSNFLFLHSHKKLILEQANKSSENIMSEIDQVFDNIHYVAMELEKEIKDDKYLQEKDALYYLNTQKKLQSYKGLGKNIGEIILIDKDADIAISSKTSYKKDLNFINRTMEDTINKRKLQFIKDDEQNIQQIAVIYPIPLFSNISRLQSTFLIDLKEIIDIYKKHIPYSKYSIDLTIDNQNIWNYTNDKDTIIEEDNGYIINIKSMYNDIQVTTKISKSELLRPITYNKNLITSIIFFLCIIGILVIIILTQYSYSPLKKLSRIIEQEDDLVQGTEIDRIKCFIQLLEDTNQSLSMTIENKEKALQEWEKYRIDIINNVSRNENDIVEQDIVEKAIDYMTNNYSDMEISVNKIADEFHISNNHLTKKFKEKIGMTPIQYMTELRINRFKELLLSTDLPIITLVEKVGYNDVSTFSKKFKSYVGVTPGQYRKEFKNKR